MTRASFGDDTDGPVYVPPPGTYDDVLGRNTDEDLTPYGCNHGGRDLTEGVPGTKKYIVGSIQTRTDGGVEGTFEGRLRK